MEAQRPRKKQKTETPARHHASRHFQTSTRTARTPRGALMPPRVTHAICVTHAVLMARPAKKWAFFGMTFFSWVHRNSKKFENECSFENEFENEFENIRRLFACSV